MSRRSRERAQRVTAAQSKKPIPSPRLQPLPDDRIVIGWFALDGQRVLCDGDACVIVGSREALLKRTDRMPSVPWQLRSTTFAEIFAGITRGGAYSFDEVAYNLFQPLASRHGLPMVPQDFSLEPPPGKTQEDHLVRIQCMFGGSWGGDGQDDDRY